MPTPLLALFLFAFPPLEARAQEPKPPASPAAATPAARPKGLSVTFESDDAEQRSKEGSHTLRAHLLSLAVERGESPHPAIAPGMFSATFRAVVPLPVRDRFRFRIEGRGSVKLVVNGEQALAGALRPGKPLESGEVKLKKGDNELVCSIASNAQGEAQLRVSWSGPTFGFEPIAPEAMEWPADDAAMAQGELLRLGQQLFADKHCAQCHATVRPTGESAFGELARKGPDLRHVGARLRAAWVAEWLRDPHAMRPEASMPRLAFESASDPADLAAWLATLGAPLPAPAFAADAAEDGARRFRELGCIACHMPPEEPKDTVAPGRRLGLGHVAAKWEPAALVQYLLDPTAEFPDVRMPHFRLENEDATALAAYLLRGAQASTPSKGDAARGKRLAQQLACYRCHELDLPEQGERFQRIVALRPEHGCLADKPTGRAPQYGLDEDERKALRAFVPRAEAMQNRAPMDYAARMVPALRCTNCHGRNGEPSVWALVARAAATTLGEPLPPEQDPVAQGVPALTWVGSKLQPSWMERFVTGREKSPRPWLHARMPSFGQRGGDVITGLVREHGHASVDEPEKAPDNELAAHGARLVKMGEGLGCVQCHGIGAQPPVQVFERAGINFAIASKRLRKDYFTRWLADPPRIDPDSRMPKYADPKGRTAIVDVLGGDAKQQFEAIWHYFRTLN